MERLKFRVYHKPTSKMFYPQDDLKCILHYDYIMHEDEIVLLMGGAVALYNCDRSWLCITDDFIPMFWTGLKDKNGKEIYEGDIVKVNTELQTGVKKQVVYRNDYASFILATKETECGILQETALKYYEVIGNIYENKELLKD